MIGINSRLSEPLKIKYAGPFADPTGYGEANRNYIAALDEVGVEMITERISYTSTQVDYGKEYEIACKLEGNPIKYDIKILHIPSDGYLKYLEPGKYHIGHLFWETDRMSKTWVWNCNLMDEIWTGSQYHKDCFRKSGVKVPIFVYPQAIDTNIKFEKPFRINGHKGFLFYSIFQWIERKNPRALLQAYWEEFQGEDNVSLLIKTYGIDLSSDATQKIRRDIEKFKMESGLKFFPRVFLKTELMSKEDVMRLHATGDCFVSAHRGEGWGVPQEEALLAGNPVISTNLGGIHEYLDDKKTAYLTEWKPVNVFNMEFAPWYDTGQVWADVDKEDLRNKMRYVFDNYSESREVGLAGRKFVMDKMSYKAVGDLLADRLRDIQRLING